MDELEAILRQRIRTEGPLSFADFMEAALYHPRLGYYSQGSPVGPSGDFVTAVNLPGFARCLARQVAEMWHELGEPERFPVVELGAGSGRLGQDLRSELRDVDGPAAEAARFVAVEPGTRQREALTEAGVDAVANLAEVPGRPLEGVVLGNEVLDALPVHLVRGTEDGLEEAFVTAENDERALSRSWLPPSTPAIGRVLAGEEVALAPGQEATVSLAALDLVDELAASLGRGYAILLDYGDEAPLLRDPARGSTLRAFRDHQLVDDPLAQPGKQDLTASVDFTAVRQRAGAHGLASALTTQGRFLVALGILEVHQALGPVAGAGIKTLVVPGAMGERFKALVLARAAPLAGLSGLQDPFAPPDLGGPDA